MAEYTHEEQVEITLDYLEDILKSDRVKKAIREEESFRAKAQGATLATIASVGGPIAVEVAKGITCVAAKKMCEEGGGNWKKLGCLVHKYLC